MENWEDDTDALLMQLPAVGCVFRKLWVRREREPHSATVSALNLVVPVKSRNLKTTPRITEEIEDVYPHEISEKQRLGYYREIDLGLRRRRTAPRTRTAPVSCSSSIACGTSTKTAG
jgi:chaperonin GroES